jgi:TolA-binding protein
MKKFLIFILVVALVVVWANNFVRSGGFEKFLDEHPNEAIVAPLEYCWGLLFALSSRHESAITKYEKVIKQYPKSTWAEAAMAAINGSLYELNQNAKCFNQGKAFLAKYPKSDRAEIVRRRMQFIAHGY